MYRQFDYLYVDFNFLIHKFTNSSEEDKKLTVGEACLKINDLLKELRHIIWICGVKKSIFISIDSSTPWTKVNQQKSRRLKKNLAANSAVNCDENSTSTVPKHNDKDQAADSDLFDSNCISPKTEFMNFVEEQLEAFIKDLIENDSMMKKLKIFFSSQDCPGEGEHKIMDFVRHLRQEPNYDPDSTHLFLSNDSDFLFLSVTLHLDNVFMMREIYQKESNCDNLTYELLDISFFLYNIYELLCKNVNEEFVREHFDELCDDLIFIHVFLGNDFVPHLPNFHIHSGSIEILIQIYFIAFNQFSDQSKCFLIDPECYRINLENFRIFLHHLAAYEKDYVDKMLVMNRGLNYNFNQQNYDKPNKDADSEIQKDWEDFFSAESGSNQADMSDAFDKSKENCESDVQKLKNFKQISPIIAESGPNYLFHEFISFSNAEATDYTFEYLRKYYYFNKFGFEDFLNVKDVCENYFEALQWIIDYYFLGQINWRFYYKSNHAPFVYDLLQNLPQVQSESKPDTNLSLAISLLDDDDINNKADSSHLPYHLEQDLPHSPLLQLLVITPECSRQLIPVDLQDLHRLQDFPKSVVFEQNEKIAEWEAVAIIEPIGYNNYEEFVIENNDNYLSLIESIKFGAILLYSANNFEFSLHNSFTESNSFCKKQLSWDSFTFNSDKRASRRYHRFSIEKLLKHDLSLAHLFSYEPCTFSKLIFKTNTNQGLNLEVLSYKYNGSQNKDSQINFMQFALNNISKTAVFNWPHLRLGIAEILCTNQGYTVKQSGFPNSQNDRQSNQKHQLSFKQYNSGKCSHLNLCRIATNSFQRITFVPKVPQVYQPLLLMRQLLVKRQNNITDDDIDDQVEESVTPMTYYVSNSLIPTPILNISTIDELIRTQQQRVCLDESDVCFSACFHEKERIFSIFHINQKLHYSSRNFHKLHQLYNNTTDGFISIQHFSYLSTIPLNITFLLLGSTKIYLSQLNSTLDFGMNILEQNYDHCFSSASDSAVRKKNPNLQPQITKLLAVPLVTLFAKFRPCLAGLHMANNLLLCDAGIEQQILDLMTELNILAQELVQGQLYKRFLNTFQHKLIDSVYSDDSNDMNSNHSIDKNLQFNEIGHDIKKIPILSDRCCVTPMEFLQIEYCFKILDHVAFICQNHGHEIGTEAVVIGIHDAELIVTGKPKQVQYAALLDLIIIDKSEKKLDYSDTVTVPSFLVLPVKRYTSIIIAQHLNSYLFSKFRAIIANYSPKSPFDTQQLKFKSGPQKLLNNSKSGTIHGAKNPNPAMNNPEKFCSTKNETSSDIFVISGGKSKPENVLNHTSSSSTTLNVNTKHQQEKTKTGRKIEAKKNMNDFQNASRQIINKSPMKQNKITGRFVPRNPANHLASLSQNRKSKSISSIGAKPPVRPEGGDKQHVVVKSFDINSIFDMNPAENQHYPQSVSSSIGQNGNESTTLNRGDKTKEKKWVKKNKSIVLVPVDQTPTDACLKSNRSDCIVDSMKNAKITPDNVKQFSGSEPSGKVDNHDKSIKVKNQPGKEKIGKKRRSYFTKNDKQLEKKSDN